MGARLNYSDEKKREILAEVETLKQSGLSSPEIIKKIGVAGGTLSSWRHSLKKFKKPKTNVVITRLSDEIQRKQPKTKSGKLAVIIGSAQDIYNFLGSYL